MLMNMDSQNFRLLSHTIVSHGSEPSAVKTLCRNRRYEPLVLYTSSEEVVPIITICHVILIQFIFLAWVWSHSRSHVCTDVFVACLICFLWDPGRARGDWDQQQKTVSRFVFRDSLETKTQKYTNMKLCQNDLADKEQIDMRQTHEWK